MSIRLLRIHKHKFNAVSTIRDGYRFDSKKEATYYDQLKLMQKAGGLHFFLRQVPIHIPGGVRLVVDFQEFRADGSVHFVDTKGMKTENFNAKKRIIEATYPIEIETY